MEILNKYWPSLENCSSNELLSMVTSTLYEACSSGKLQLNQLLSIWPNGKQIIESVTTAMKDIKQPSNYQQFRFAPWVNSESISPSSHSISTYTTLLSIALDRYINTSETMPSKLDFKSSLSIFNILDHLVTLCLTQVCLWILTKPQKSLHLFMNDRIAKETLETILSMVATVFTHSFSLAVFMMQLLSVQKQPFTLDISLYIKQLISSAKLQNNKAIVDVLHQIWNAFCNISRPTYHDELEASLHPYSTSEKQSELSKCAFPVTQQFDLICPLLNAHWILQEAILEPVIFDDALQSYAYNLWIIRDMFMLPLEAFYAKLLWWGLQLENSVHPSHPLVHKARIGVVYVLPQILCFLDSIKRSLLISGAIPSPSSSEEDIVLAMEFFFNNAQQLTTNVSELNYQILLDFIDSCRQIGLISQHSITTSETIQRILVCKDFKKMTSHCQQFGQMSTMKTPPPPSLITQVGEIPEVEMGTTFQSISNESQRENQPPITSTLTVSKCKSFFRSYGTPTFNSSVVFDRLLSDEDRTSFTNHLLHLIEGMKETLSCQPHTIQGILDFLKDSEDFKFCSEEIVQNLDNSSGKIESPQTLSYSSRHCVVYEHLSDESVINIILSHVKLEDLLDICFRQLQPLGFDSSELSVVKFTYILFFLTKLVTYVISSSLEQKVETIKATILETVKKCSNSIKASNDDNHHKDRTHNNHNNHSKSNGHYKTVSDEVSNGGVSASTDPSGTIIGLVEFVLVNLLSVDINESFELPPFEIDGIANLIFSANSNVTLGSYLVIAPPWYHLVYLNSTLHFVCHLTSVEGSEPGKTPQLLGPLVEGLIQYISLCPFLLPFVLHFVCKELCFGANDSRRWLHETVYPTLLHHLLSKFTLNQTSSASITKSSDLSSSSLAMMMTGLSSSGTAILSPNSSSSGFIIPSHFKFISFEFCRPFLERLVSSHSYSKELDIVKQLATSEMFFPPAIHRIPGLANLEEGMIDTTLDETISRTFIAAAWIAKPAVFRYLLQPVIRWAQSRHPVEVIHRLFTLCNPTSEELSRMGYQGLYPHRTSGIDNLIHLLTYYLPSHFACATLDVFAVSSVRGVKTVPESQDLARLCIGCAAGMLQKIPNTSLLRVYSIGEELSLSLEEPQVSSMIDSIHKFSKMCIDILAWKLESKAIAGVVDAVAALSLYPLQTLTKIPKFVQLQKDNFNELMSLLIHAGIPNTALQMVISCFTLVQMNSLSSSDESLTSSVQISAPADIWDRYFKILMSMESHRPKLAQPELDRPEALEVFELI